MHRRDFFSSVVTMGAMASCCPFSFGNTPTADPDPAEPLEYENGVFVGSDGKQKLWLWKYKKQQGIWQGWFEDEQNKTWGFLDADNRLWQSGPDKMNLRKDLFLQMTPDGSLRIFTERCFNRI